MPVLDAAQLKRINWDFPLTGNVKGSVQSIHWFPGNFIAQIPAALIHVLSSPGDVVLDPFAGSGTTGIEAVRLGRNAIVSDRMSVSSMIAAAKAALLSGAIDARFADDLLVALTFDQQCRSDSVGEKGEGSDEALRDWYSEDTLSQLRFLWKIIEAKGSRERDVLLALFSDVLFQCASTGGAPTRTGKKRRHHWGWVADNVLPKEKIEHNAIELFRERLVTLPTQEFLLHRTSGTLAILQQDARCLSLRDSSVDLVVTSPPYVGMIDYVHANRLIYLWMGWPFKHERQAEIGARFRRKRKSAVDEYFSEMRAVRNEIVRVLKPGGFCALVLGESRRFPGAAQRVFSDFGMLATLQWGPIARNPSRRRVSERGASEPIEYIAIFQKQ
ncbi:site-specific DNA-methyltransferase [Bradyrhizobium sp. 83012]|uniref:Site-specific DNA-methyltransferase n=1 Tax=Bradyrhizobium aeschynomenes TaxID=2734909 RepID=A0ABX2CCB5_9BRAD|nr:site-specific DNA-methyltransferase [Bradyrhizobium aeschynomenes]